MSEPSISVFIESSQDPILVSPGQGPTSPIDLTIVITCTGKPDTPVPVSRVQIDIPMGDNARALSANKASISTSIDIDPKWGWGTWASVPDYNPSFAFVTQDGTSINFTNEHSLAFTLSNVTINQEVGVVPVTVCLQTVENHQQKTTATGTTEIHKMPFGFSLSELTTEPPNATIKPGESITLSWTGSSNATYSLYIGSKDPIHAEPVETYHVPPELLPPAGQDVNVRLEASVEIASGRATYSRTRQIVVEPGVPEITKFEGKLEHVNGKVQLHFTWDTKNAHYCEMSGDPQQLKTTVPTDDAYTVTPNVEKPLRSRYTLTAKNDAGTDSKTLMLPGWQVSLPSIPVGEAPCGMCMTPDGTVLFVADWHTNTVTAMQVATQKRLGEPILVGHWPVAVCVSPDGARLFVANKEDKTVTAIDVTTRQPLGQPIPVGGMPLGGCVTPDGAHLFVVVMGDEAGKNFDTRTLIAIDVATRQPLGQPLELGQSAATAVCVSPDGAVLFVANSGANTVTAIDAKTWQPLGQPIPVGQKPQGVCVSPDGAVLFVANWEDHTVTAIDIKTRQPLGQPIPVGWDLKAVCGVCVSPDGTRLFVANELECAVTALTPSTGALKPQ